MGVPNRACLAQSQSPRRLEVCWPRSFPHRQRSAWPCRLGPDRRVPPAAEESLEAAQKELADLKAKGPEVRELTQEEKDALTAEAVNKVKAESAEQLQGLEKKLAAADPNVAEFKVRFTSWQEEYQKMTEVLGRIAQADEERGAKLRQAVKAALEQMATS